MLLALSSIVAAAGDLTISDLAGRWISASETDGKSDVILDVSSEGYVSILRNYGESRAANCGTGSKSVSQLNEVFVFECSPVKGLLSYKLVVVHWTSETFRFLVGTFYEFGRNSSFHAFHVELMLVRHSDNKPFKFVPGLWPSTGLSSAAPLN